MTQLDEKALKVAKAVEGMPTEYVIRAYLDALPPARVAWARPDILETTGLHMVSKWASSFPDSGITQIEIREVRPSPPSVEG